MSIVLTQNTERSEKCPLLNARYLWIITKVTSDIVHLCEIASDSQVLRQILPTRSWRVVRWGQRFWVINVAKWERFNAGCGRSALVSVMLLQWSRGCFYLMQLVLEQYQSLISPLRLVCHWEGDTRINKTFQVPKYVCNIRVWYNWLYINTSAFSCQAIANMHTYFMGFFTHKD